MLEFLSQIHCKKIQSWLEERFDLNARVAGLTFTSKCTDQFVNARKREEKLI